MTRDRDHYIDKHTPRGGVPEFVEEECTGKYDGDDLRAARQKRPTDERIARLEDKHDSLVRVVGDLRVSVGNMDGKLDTVLSHVTATHLAAEKTEQVRLTSRAKLIVGVVGAVCTAIGVVVTAVLAGCF